MFFVFFHFPCSLNALMYDNKVLFVLCIDMHIEIYWLIRKRSRLRLKDFKHMFIPFYVSEFKISDSESQLSLGVYFHYTRISWAVNHPKTIFMIYLHNY